MRRWGKLFVVGSALALTAQVAFAQERAEGAGRLEVTGFPGGGILFTEGGNEDNEPDFGDYALGGSATYNFNRWWGVEGEIGAGLGVDQRLQFGRRGSVGETSPPDMLAYHGNVVAYPAGNQRSFVPYATGGIGGLTMFEERAIGFGDDETFLTGNVGGGVKWYSGRWGVRGDYRFFAVDSKDDAPAFFGRDNRYGHRVYGGIILNLLR